MSNTLEQDIKACSSILAATHNGFIATGKLISEACDRHEGFIDHLHKTLRGSVSVTYIRRLERCGRGELIPELVVCVGPAQTWLEKLSVQDQKKAISGVNWPVGNDDTDTRIKLVSDMDYHEAKAAFSGGVIAATSTIRVRTQEITDALDAANYRRNKIYSDTEKKERKIRAKITKLGIVVFPTYVLWNGTKLNQEDIDFLASEMYRITK